ncbi:MAG: hypothetical protein AB8H03_14990 [Saprospiraceae bacterium]
MKNQYILYCLMLLFLVACSSNDNNPDSSTADSTDTTEQSPPEKIIDEEKKEPLSEPTPTDDLETITLKTREEFSRIETLLGQGKLTQKVKEYNCPDDPEGGMFTFFYDGNILVKVDHNFYSGDHYGQESSYYFKDGDLIFGFHRSSSWTFAASEKADGTPNTKDDIHIQRDYFNEGKIVKQLFKDYTNYSNKKEKIEREIPNKTIGEGVYKTLDGKQVLQFSSKDKLTCKMMSEKDSMQ